MRGLSPPARVRQGPERWAGRGSGDHRPRVAAAAVAGLGLLTPAGRRSQATTAAVMTRACSIGAVLALPTIGIIIASPLRCGQQERGAAAPVDAVTLPAGLGAVGDAHAGATVQHRSRVAADPARSADRRDGRRRGDRVAQPVHADRRVQARTAEAGRPSRCRRIACAQGRDHGRRGGWWGRRPGDVTAVELPEGPHEPLGRV